LRIGGTLGAGRRPCSGWELPEVPEAVLEATGEPVARQLVPREAVFIDSRAAAEEVLPRLLGARVLGVDCEGVALGRWGRLCLCQVAAPGRVYLFDALREGVLDTLRPVLSAKGIIKVMHDCREDASALFSQFDVELAGVFDTQVAHTMLLEQRVSRPYQISLNELLKSMLQLQNEKQVPLSKRMKDDPNMWFYRPMQQDLLSYAVQDVMYLPLLHRRMCKELGDPSGGQVLLRSQKYSDYARMNLHIASPKAVEKRGLRLQAMLATQTEAAWHFKLNLGASRHGAVSRPEALSRFQELQFGDIVDCWVSAWTTNSSIIFIERLESTTTFPEPPDINSWRFQRKRRRPPGGR